MLAKRTLKINWCIVFYTVVVAFPFNLSSFRTNRNNMVDYKKFASVKEEGQLIDSKDLATIADNISPISGAIRMIKKSTANTIAIGEGSHGTKEFYAHRCDLTKQLIQEKRCNCVMIEGDWPDTASLHRYVMGMSDMSLTEAMGGYQNFPRWMWRNETMKEFVQWLHDHNQQLPVAQRCGLLGLDVYSLHLSMDAVLSYLQKADPETAAIVAREYSCFDKFGDDAQTYGALVQRGKVQGCRNAAMRALSLMNDHVADYVKSAQADDLFALDDAFIAQMNAEVVVSAEKYYTSMTFQKVREHFGDTRNAAHMVVWAHNSHLGDARYTHLDASRYTSGQELNIGQLLKEKYGADCLLVGQLTYSGRVLASDDWGGKGKVKVVRNALSDSFEDFFHTCSQKVCCSLIQHTGSIVRFTLSTLLL